jgi:hypothetical protein
MCVTYRLCFPVNYYNQPQRDFAQETAECPAEEGEDDQPGQKEAEEGEEDALEEDVQVQKHAHHEAARLLQPPPFAEDAPAEELPGDMLPAALGNNAEEPWEARTPVPAPSVPLQQSDPAVLEAMLPSSSDSDAALQRAGHDRAHSGNTGGTAVSRHRASQSVMEDSEHTRQLAEEVEALLLRSSGDNENPWDQIFRDVSDRPREEGSGDLEMRDLEAGQPAGAASTTSTAYRDASSRVPSASSSAAEQASLVHRRGAGSKSSIGSSSSAMQRAGTVTGGSVGASGRGRAYSAEREVDEEAALVSSYFTCFCEQEEVKEGAGSGGAKRGGRGATAWEEEECKMAYEPGEGDEEVAGRGWRPRRRSGEGCAGTQRGGRRLWDQVTSACAIM